MRNAAPGPLCVMDAIKGPIEERHTGGLAIMVPANQWNWFRPNSVVDDRGGVFEVVNR